MYIIKIVEALQNSWCKETCYPMSRNDWTEEKKALGQCAVTALVI